MTLLYKSFRCVRLSDAHLVEAFVIAPTKVTRVMDEMAGPGFVLQSRGYLLNLGRS